MNKKNSNLLQPKLLLRYAPGHMRDIDDDNLKLSYSNLFNLTASAPYYGDSTVLRTPPPDLPSLLLKERIVYLGLPLFSDDDAKRQLGIDVTELIIAQLLYLEFDNPEGLQKFANDEELKAKRAAAGAMLETTIVTPMSTESFTNFKP